MWNLTTIHCICSIGFVVQPGTYHTHVLLSAYIHNQERKEQSTFSDCALFGVYILQQLHTNLISKQRESMAFNNAYLVLCEVVDGGVFQFLVLVLHVLQDLMEVLAMLKEQGREINSRTRTLTTNSQLHIVLLPSH